MGTFIQFMAQQLLLPYTTRRSQKGREVLVQATSSFLAANSLNANRVAQMEEEYTSPHLNPRRCLLKNQHLINAKLLLLGSTVAPFTSELQGIASFPKYVAMNVAQQQLIAASLIMFIAQAMLNIRIKVSEKSG